MSGYNRFEQTIGSVLDRFPRVKGAVETTYQRLNYHLFADSGFEYSVTDGATVQLAGDAFDTSIDHPHFVGFYDCIPWSATMDRFFVHELTDEGCQITVITEGSTHPVSHTQAWNYQQGSRLHWHPKREEEVLYNEIVDDRPRAIRSSLDGETLQTYPLPLQAINPSSGGFFSVNFGRLARNSPAYGYGFEDSVFRQIDQDGLYYVEADGSNQIVVSFAQLIEAAPDTVSPDDHYIHHVRCSPDGDQIAFLHRWRDASHRHTRLLITDMDGSISYQLQDRYLSHFDWTIDSRLLFWGRTETYGKGYHLLNPETGDLRYLDTLAGQGDGHPSVAPNQEWFVTDTYPDRHRNRHLFLVKLDTQEIIELGKFRSPFEYEDANRCDLHPRWSPDGSQIAIDSTHEGIRRTYLVDVSELI